MNRVRALEHEAMDRREAFVSTLSEARRRLSVESLKEEAIERAHRAGERALAADSGRVVELFIVAIALAAVAVSVMSKRTQRFPDGVRRRAVGVPARRTIHQTPEEIEHGDDPKEFTGGIGQGQRAQP